MKNHKKYVIGLTAFVCLILNTSCEGTRVANGTVVDKSSNMPLDSVLCVVIETNAFSYTDAEGNYNLEGPFGGCGKECQDMTVEFSKEGYETMTILNPGSSAVQME